MTAAGAMHDDDGMLYDAMLAAAREGCCADRRKPCEMHGAWADGLEAGIDAAYAHARGLLSAGDD